MTMTMSSNGASITINFHALGSRIHSNFNDANRRSPLLLILDLHGVLIQRIGKKHPEMGRLTHNRRPPYMRHNHHDIWLRPYLRKFLTIASARHNIAIWSAAQLQTINPLMQEMSDLTQLEPPFRQRCAYIFDRRRCRPDTDRRNGCYSVVKYLPDVWSTPPFQYGVPSPSSSQPSIAKHIRPAIQFNERNTIIIDDTFAKVRYHPDSALVLPEYNVYNYNFTYDNDDTLLWILLYLEYLIDASGLESYNQNGEKCASQPDQNLSPGIAALRPALYSFENFWTLGFHHAFNSSTPYQRDTYKSLAYVFFPSELIGDMPEGERTLPRAEH